MGLVELARLTGEERYLDQAQLFIDRRGHHTLADIDWSRAYFQDEMPIRDADVFRGHAVRAMYLAAGAVDVAVERGDDELLAAVIRQWENTIARRTYVTGGMGSQHTGEAFGDDFALPPDRAYSETCAGVGSVMLAWRLLLATGEARFADLIERTLYNVVATSPSPDGRAFFYANPLHQRVPGAVPPLDVESHRASSSLRAPWFHVSCCPTNVARTFASLAVYLATVDEGGLQLHQYADSRIRTELEDGRTVGVDVATGYPHQGAVSLTVIETSDRPWTLSLRVPAWATGATVIDPDGVSKPARGAVSMDRTFGVGDVIRLELPIEPRWTFPDPRIDAIRGCIAVERGPLVMCVESVDLPDQRNVGSVWVDPSVSPSDQGDSVIVTGQLSDLKPEAWPYRGDTTAELSGPDSDVEVPLVPYYHWANRGSATMRVWIPVVPQEARPSN
jgi:hypothetical protein